jgi:hypothetical protein
VSKNRQSMGGALDAGLLAMGRINMEKEGTGSCTDPEGECRNSPILDKSGKPSHRLGLWLSCNCGLCPDKAHLGRFLLS